MPKKNSAEKRAARQLAAEREIPYTAALRIVREERAKEREAALTETIANPPAADATAAGTRSITEGLTEEEARDRGLLPPRVKGALAAQLDAQETASAALAETIANPPEPTIHVNRCNHGPGECE